jgi:hypothetical protein
MLVITPPGSDEASPTYILSAPAQDMPGLWPQFQWSDLRPLRAYRCGHGDRKEYAATRWNGIVGPEESPDDSRESG